MPLFISGPAHNRVRTEIDLPPGSATWSSRRGATDLNAPDGGGQARITATDTPGKCAITHDFDTSPAIVTPQDYPAMLKVESALGRKSSKVFLLEKD